jgi:hypothetical protein
MIILINFNWKSSIYHFGFTTVSLVSISSQTSGPRQIKFEVFFQKKSKKPRVRQMQSIPKKEKLNIFDMAWQPLLRVFPNSIKVHHHVRQLFETFFQLYKTASSCTPATNLNNTRNAIQTCVYLWWQLCYENLWKWGTGTGPICKLYYIITMVSWLYHSSEKVAWNK